jgi:hypothetical protein
MKEYCLGAILVLLLTVFIFGIVLGIKGELRTVPKKKKR